MNISELFSNPETKLEIIKIVLAIASGLFCASAVATACKIYHIKYKWLFIIACAVFTPLTPFFFAFHKVFKTEVPFVCSKCGRKAPKDRKVCKHCGNERFITYQVENFGEMKNKIIISLVVAVLLYGASYWLTNYSPLAESVYENTYDEEVYENSDGETEFDLEDDSEYGLDSEVKVCL